MIIAILLSLFTIAGGAWGWIKGTRDLEAPPERHDQPIGMGRRQFARQLKRRYRRRRILLTVTGAVGAGVGSFALLLVASMWRWSR